MTPHRLLAASAAILLSTCTGVVAQDPGTLNPQPLPPLANPDAPSTPANELFGRKTTPADMQPQVIGFYSHGCVAGAEALPVNGPAWQVMRLSRNRNWGHPALIRLLETLAVQARAEAGWPGLLVGDLSQPRGGPMLTGHASHQVGLDADIWLTPMPKRELTRAEREEMSATMVVAADKRDVDPAVWTPAHAGLIKLAAKMPEVQRIFINAAIKKALCREPDSDPSWQRKVRAYWGHNYHFHIRIRCPDDSPGCTPQLEPRGGDGCGKELDWWFKASVLNPPPAKKPAAKRRSLTMAKLPRECRAVLKAP
ncbi:MAG: penicillin-insensitive murein endopeptidase [Xanthobacteraceae bacterium]